MSAISTYLEYIRSKIYAKDVRTAIVNAISQCYDDVNKPALQTEAMQAAVQAKIDAGEMAAYTVADNTFEGSKLKDGTITANKIASNVISNITNINTEKINDESFWIQGYWAVTTGDIVSGENWNRSLKAIDDTIESIISTDDIKLLLMAYDGSTYVGTWFGENFSKTYVASYVSHEISFTEFRKKYPAYTFRVSVTKTTGGALLPSETASKVTIVRSISKINRNDIRFMYGNLVNEKYWQNGGIDATGMDTTENTVNFYKRICTINKMRFLLPVTITPKSGYVLSVSQYASDGTFEKQFSAWSGLPYTLSDANKLYRIVIKASDDSVLETSNIDTYISAKLTDVKTDTTLTKPGVPADSRAAGEMFSAFSYWLTNDVETALLNCFSHVAWTDQYGQDCYNALARAFDQSPQPPKITTPKIDIYDQICGKNNDYRSVPGAGITIFYKLDSPSTKLHIAGILPNSITDMNGQPNASMQIYNGDTYVNFVNEINGHAELSLRWLKWDKSSAVHTEYEASYNVSTYDRIRFCVDTSHLEDSYMYDVETGQVFFAGMNTPYCGMSNISEAS